MSQGQGFDFATSVTSLARNLIFIDDAWLVCNAASSCGITRFLARSMRGFMVTALELGNVPFVLPLIIFLGTSKDKILPVWEWRHVFKRVRVCLPLDRLSFYSFLIPTGWNGPLKIIFLEFTCVKILFAFPYLVMQIVPPGVAKVLLNFAHVFHAFFRVVW